MKKFELINTDSPNLHEEDFDYSKVPLIKLEDRISVANKPENIWITDTTFRDGQQARPPYEADQIVELFKFMHKLGGPNGVIRQSEFFLYSDKDKEAVRKCQEKDFEFPEITGWIRANKRDFQLVKTRLTT